MFAELHAHTSFSFLDGASPPEDLVARCADLEIPAIAALDRNGVYGGPRLRKAAKRLVPRALIGAGNRRDRNHAQTKAATRLCVGRTLPPNRCSSVSIGGHKTWQRGA